MDDVTPNRKPEIVGEVIAEVGGLIDWSRLTLGIHGEDLDPDEISRLLGCAPSTAHRRGDACRGGPPWPRGAWLLSVEGKSPTGPEELVQLLLASLPADDGLWANLRSRFRLQLSFGIFTERWNRGFDLSADAVRRINALGAGLGFDIYANLEDGDDGQPGTAPDPARTFAPGVRSSPSGPDG
jgi:hypothetical protein